MGDFLKKAAEFLKNEESSDNPDILKQRLKEDREIIKRQFELIKKYISLPNNYAYIVSVHDAGPEHEASATILFNGHLLHVGFEKSLDVSPGQMVVISSKTSQIIEKVETEFFGPTAVVSKIEGVDIDFCEVQFRSDTLIVLKGLFGKKSAELALEVGDRVILDSSASLIIANLGKDDHKFKLNYEPKVAWDDIIGQGAAKEKLKEAIELPYTHPELFKHHNKKQSRGVLLLGPPGNGKSMLMEASASALAKIHGESALQSGYVLLNAPDILEELVGRAEKAIKSMFEKGEEHFEKYKYPAIIAIEEPDAVFIKRGTGKSSDVERSLVTTLLTQMNKTRSIIMMATNRADILDPALVRAKRIDHKIYVGRPDKKSAAKVMEINLKGAPLDGTPETLGQFASEEIFSEKRALYQISRKSSVVPLFFTFADLISCADIAAIAEKATSISFQRDVKNNTETNTGQKEISEAIDESFAEKTHIDHKDELSEFVEKIKDDFTGIKELRQAKN